MARRARRVLAAVGAGATVLPLTLLTQLPAAADPASPHDWQVSHVTESPQFTVLRDVTAVSADEAWAVGKSSTRAGSNPRAYRFDGQQWQRQRLPQGLGSVGLERVDASSGNDVWGMATDVNGSTVRVLHYDGSAWSTYQLGTQVRNGDIESVSVGEAWYVGSDSGQLTTRHHTGGQWNVVPVPGSEPGTLRSVSASGSGDVWAGGSRDNQPFAMRWDGARWQALAPPEQTPPEGATDFYAKLVDVATLPSGEVYAVGSAQWEEDFEPRSRAFAYRLDGGSWQPVQVPEDVSPRRMVTDGQAHVWLIAGGSDPLRLSGGEWTAFPEPEVQGSPATCSSIAGAAGGGPTWCAGAVQGDDSEDYEGVLLRRG